MPIDASVKPSRIPPSVWSARDIRRRRNTWAYSRLFCLQAGVGEKGAGAAGRELDDRVVIYVCHAKIAALSNARVDTYFLNSQRISVSSALTSKQVTMGK